MLAAFAFQPYSLFFRMRQVRTHILGYITVYCFKWMEYINPTEQFECGPVSYINRLNDEEFDIVICVFMYLPYIVIMTNASFITWPKAVVDPFHWSHTGVKNQKCFKLRKEIRYFPLKLLKNEIFMLTLDDWKANVKNQYYPI